MRKWLIGAGSVIAVVLVTLVVLPVPQPGPSNTEVVVGKVVSVEATPEGDIEIRLQSDPRTFYINRALGAGVVPEQLSAQLTGRSAALKVIRRWWSPLDPAHQMAPLAAVLDAEGQELFSRL